MKGKREGPGRIRDGEALRGAERDQEEDLA